MATTARRRAPGPAALLVLVALLVLQLSPPCAADGMSCSSMLAPCLGYVKSGGTVPPACCAGIKRLVSETAAYHRVSCFCFKGLAAAAPPPYVGRATGLPDRCGVQLGYKLSPDMDCKSIK